MTAQERHDRLIRLARKRHDLAAVAILEADCQYRPEPTTPIVVMAPWAGVRWSRAA